MMSKHQPPASGHIEIEIDLAKPARLRVLGTHEHTFKERVWKLIGNTDYLLLSKVKISLEWFINEIQCQPIDFHISMDTFTNPLLEVLCGPEGLLVTKAQIETLSYSWLDCQEHDFHFNCEKEYLKLTIQFDPAHFLLKEGLVFVHLENNLCCAINNYKSRTIELLKIRKSMMKLMHSTSMKLPLTLDEKVFHRNKLVGFEIVEFDDLSSSDS